MSSVGPGLSIDARRHFLHALRRALRPIVRLLIRNGIRYDQFADVARGAYIESAVRDGIAASPKPTREQIALITGIPRQRVDHYIDDEGSLPEAKSTLTNVLVEILHKWHTDPRYLSPDGAPLALELDTASGPTFQGLIAEVTSQTKFELVLEELLQAKSITYSDERRVRAVTRCFIWPQGGAASIEHFGTALTQLIETHEYNFNSAHSDNKRLERSVFADQGLNRDLLPKFQAHAQARADQLLLDLDDWLGRCADANDEHPGPRVETGVNVFLYVDPPPDTRALSTLAQPCRQEALWNNGPDP